MSNEVYKWYPVCTNPRAEKKAAELLSLKGIEVYLPLQKQLKQWSDRKKWVEEPLIKSYLFVYISLNKLSEVLMTRGVSRFIYFSGKISSIPEIQIESLKRALLYNADLELATRQFKKGEQVSIVSGPLAGLKGELIQMYSQKQLLIRLEGTGHSILIKTRSTFFDNVELA